MIIISDCISSKSDEGCTKIAGSLAKRLKLKLNAKLLTYKAKSELSDIYFDKLNPLFLNKKLLHIVRSSKEEVLYIPISSNTKAGVIRCCVLSLFCRKQVIVLFAQHHKMDAITSFLLRLSKVKVIVLSKGSYEFYKKSTGNRTIYLKTGIDTKKFIPINTEKKTELAIKYGIDTNKRTILHVGHLKAGRNVDKLLKIDDKYNVILVTSSLTANEQDLELRKKIQEKSNIKLIDTYIEKIEEIYQLADVYFFPVVEEGNCIDVPLSVLEAASCNIPVICTEYGELTEFKEKNGFLFINSLDTTTINSLIEKALCFEKLDNREAVCEYDWDISINKICNIIYK